MHSIDVYRILCQVDFPTHRLRPPYNMMEIIDTIDRTTFNKLITSLSKPTATVKTKKGSSEEHGIKIYY